MANKHMKRCSASLVIKKMQTETIRYHYTPIRLANFLKLTIPSADKYMGHWIFHTVPVGMQNGTAAVENSFL